MSDHCEIRIDPENWLGLGMDTEMQVYVTEAQPEPQKEADWHS